MITPLQLNPTLFRRAASRVLLNGPPLSGKTSSCKTFPRARWSKVLGRSIAGSTHIIVAPGEFGYSSVLPEEDFHVHAWEVAPGGAPGEAQTVYRIVQECVTDILTGKHGSVETLVLDGLHHLYTLIMKARGWTAASVDDKESGRQYAKYHDEFRNFVARLLGSAVPLVAATVYDGLELADPEMPKGLKQVFPQLPGIMAKEVMGMFPMVMHTARVPQPGKPDDAFTWTLRATGKLQAAGMHLPAEIARRLPADIPVVCGTNGEWTGGWFTVEAALKAAGL